MKNIQSRSLRKQQYGAIQQKNLKAVLREELITNFGFENMSVIADALIERFLKIIEPFFSSEQLVPGEFIWLAADKEQENKKGASKLKLKQIRLNLMSRTELDKLVGGDPQAEIRRRQIIRLMKDAYAQGAALTYADLSVLLGCGYNAIASAVKIYKKDHPDEFIPHRGTVHDIGPTLTHKEQAVNFYMRGLLTQEIAEKINHHPVNVDRYVGNYQRVSELLDKKYDVQKIALCARIRKNVVEEYKNIYDKIKSQARELKKTRTFKINRAWMYFNSSAKKVRSF